MTTHNPVHHLASSCVDAFGDPVAAAHEWREPLHVRHCRHPTTCTASYLYRHGCAALQGDGTHALLHELHQTFPAVWFPEGFRDGHDVAIDVVKGDRFDDHHLDSSWQVGARRSHVVRCDGAYPALLLGYDDGRLQLLHCCVVNEVDGPA